MGTCESDIYNPEENKEDNSEEYIDKDFMQYVVLANWKPDEIDGSNSNNQLNFGKRNLDYVKGPIQQSRITSNQDFYNNNSPNIYQSNLKALNYNEQQFGVSTLAISRYTEISKSDILLQHKNQSIQPFNYQTDNLQQSQIKQVQF